MSFKSEISKELKRVIDKIESKDKNLAVAVNKKIKQIISFDIITINHFKNLKGNISDYKRVQIGSFVLIFQVKGDTIIFKRFVHHDKAY